MTLRELARGVAAISNVLLMGSLLLALVWWPVSLKLFGAAWVLYAAAWLVEGAAANETAALAPAEGRPIPE